MSGRSSARRPRTTDTTVMATNISPQLVQLIDVPLWMQEKLHGLQHTRFEAIRMIYRTREARRTSDPDIARLIPEYFEEGWMEELDRQIDELQSRIWGIVTTKLN